VVIWITGLSGAGKTTLASALKKDLDAQDKASVLLDGDMLRWALSKQEGSYNDGSRKQLAMSYARLAKLLSDQNIITIVATISMFDDVRQWNREQNSNYCEVYLKVPQSIRVERDPKKLYAEKKDMVEFDKGFEEPKAPDMVFTHEHTIKHMVEVIKQSILEEVYET
jgi:adenylylsulfate kinase-like enzyme